MTDEVDDIVAAWSAVRPDLDVSPMQVLSRLRRIAQVLDERRDAAFGAHGLAAHEFDVLAALRRAQDVRGLTPGQLVEATHVTSGTMTNRLEKLAQRRLVTRSPHPSDGRQTLVRLTPAGRRRVDGALGALLDFEATVLSGLSPRERSSLTSGLRLLLAAAGSELGAS